MSSAPDDCPEYKAQPLKILLRLCWRATRLLALFCLIMIGLSLSGCVDRFYFYPERDPNLAPPTELGRVDVGTLESLDGTRLQTWFRPAQTDPRALVLQVHGNAANLGNHIYAVEWLPSIGCEVLAFDYRGYGASEGQVRTRRGPTQDTRAALRRAKQLATEHRLPLIVLGQSIGGNLALAALEQEGLEGVDGLAIDSTFSSWRAIARDQAGPVISLLISNRNSAQHILPELPADLPVLLIHGAEDSIIGPQHFHTLAATRAHQPQTRAVLIPDADHIESLTLREGQQHFSELVTAALQHFARRQQAQPHR